MDSHRNFTKCVSFQSPQSQKPTFMATNNNNNNNNNNNGFNEHFNKVGSSMLHVLKYISTIKFRCITIIH